MMWKLSGFIAKSLRLQVSSLFVDPSAFKPVGLFHSCSSRHPLCLWGAAALGVSSAALSAVGCTRLEMLWKWLSWGWGESSVPQSERFGSFLSTELGGTSSSEP